MLDEYIKHARLILPDGWEIKSVTCTHLRKTNLVGPFGEHQAKTICIDCLAFIDWVVAAAPPADDIKAMKNTLFILLKGPLFPASTYVDKKTGDTKSFDDREFFEKMFNRDTWSPAQTALVKRKLEFYERNAHKLPKEPPPPPAPVAADLGFDVPF